MNKSFLSSLSLAVLLIFAILHAPIRASANVLGDVETFSVDPDLLGFVSVHSSETLKPGWVNLGVFGYYSANNFLTYQNLNNPFLPNYQKEYNFNDKMITTEVFASIGLLPHLEFTINMPVVLYQDYDHSQAASVDVTHGIQSFRPGLKYNFWKTQTQGLALLLSADIPVDGTDAYLGNKQNPIFNIEGAWDIHLTEASLFGINVGYRKRSPGNPTSNVADPLHDQFTGSAGFTHSFYSRWSWTAELFGSTPIDKGLYPSTTALTTLEVLGALNYRALENLFLHGGATGNLIGGSLSPDYRIFAGLNYMFDLFSSSKAATDSLDLNDKNKLTALSLTPKKATVATGSQRVFSASGGRGYYRYEVVSGDGVIDTDSGKFTAGNPGNNRLRVTDGDGNTSEAVVAVTGGAVDKTPAEPIAPKSSLTLSPASSSLYEGSRANFTAQGGTTPYHYMVSSGAGQIDEQTGEYFAPAEVTDEEITVTDAGGAQAVAHVRVRAIPKATKEFVLNNLRFKFNSDTLVPASVPLLKSAIRKMKTLKIKSMIVAGNTDSIGKAAYNKKLSIKRADAIRLILIRDLNLDPSAVTAVGFGKERPLVKPERSPADRLKNRRVELKLYAQ